MRAGVGVSPTGSRALPDFLPEVDNSGYKGTIIEHVDNALQSGVPRRQPCTDKEGHMVTQAVIGFPLDVLVFLYTA